MNETTQTQVHALQDPVAKDFFTATFIVSLLVNLTVAVTWMTLALAA